MTNETPTVIVTPRQLGCRLRHVRRGLGLSQVAMAAEVGFLGRAQIARIEAGTRNVWPEELARIAQLGGVTIDVLMLPTHLMGEASIAWYPHPPEDPGLAERHLAVGRWLANATRGPYRPPFHHATRFSPAVSRVEADQVIEQMICETAERMATWMNRFSLKQTPPVQWQRLSDLLAQHLGFCLLVADLPEGVLSGHCRLAEYDAIVLSSSLDSAQRTEALLREHYRLGAFGAPAKLCKPEVIGRWVQSATAKLDSLKTFQPEPVLPAPGKELAEQVFFGLKDGIVRPKQMIQLLGFEDNKALDAVLQQV